MKAGKVGKSVSRKNNRTNERHDLIELNNMQGFSEKSEMLSEVRIFIDF